MKLDSQTFKLLIDIVEQADPNITYSHLKSNLGKETANNLIQNNYFNKGRDLETYYLPGQDREVYVEWNNDENSYFYLSDFGKLLPVEEEEVKTYDINFTKLTEFIANQFDISKNSRKDSNSYLNDLLFFVGDTNINKKKHAIFFARRLTNQMIFRDVDQLFLDESPTKFPKLILTSSNEYCPTKLSDDGKIISIPKLLTFSKDKLFNMDYISNVLGKGAGDEYKPYIHCSEGGAVLFIGDESYDVGGVSQRQAIEIMCRHYLKNGNEKIRWRTVMDEINPDSDSRARDLFRKSQISDLIQSKNGFVWFKTEENS
jgi:hypothetical protein